MNNRERFTVAIVNFKYADVGLIHWQIVAFLERETVKLLSCVKDPVENYMVQFVVWSHLRFVERVFRLADFLRIKIPVPWRDLEAAFLLIDNFLHVCCFTFRIRDRRRREIGQQFVYRGNIVRGLVFELIRRPIWIPQQLCFLGAQLRGAQDNVARVELTAFAVARE